MMRYKLVDLTQVTWAADTGCYLQPAKHDDERYLAWLAERPRGNCLFATAPDSLGDPVATWQRSSAMLPRIRALGYPAALVAQDGLEAADLDWDAFDALFIGGTTQWKLGPEALELGREAKRRGKHLHWGRVNSLRRMLLARQAGADSCDGTKIAYGPDLFAPRFRRWLDRANAQGVLL